MVRRLARSRLPLTDSANLSIIARCDVRILGRRGNNAPRFALGCSGKQSHAYFSSLRRGCHADHPDDQWVGPSCARERNTEPHMHFVDLGEKNHALGSDRSVEFQRGHRDRLAIQLKIHTRRASRGSGSACRPETFDASRTVKRSRHSTRPGSTRNGCGDSCNSKVSSVLMPTRCRGLVAPAGRCCAMSLPPARNS